MAEDQRRIQNSTLQPRRAAHSNVQGSKGQSPKVFRQHVSTGVLSFGSTFTNCRFGPVASGLNVDNTYINCEFSSACSGVVNVGNSYVNCRMITHGCQNGSLNHSSTRGIGNRINSICSSFRAPSLTDFNDKPEQ